MVTCAPRVVKAAPPHSSVKSLFLNSGRFFSCAVPAVMPCPSMSSVPRLGAPLSLAVPQPFLLADRDGDVLVDLLAGLRVGQDDEPGAAVDVAEHHGPVAGRLADVAELEVARGVVDRGAQPVQG